MKVDMDKLSAAVDAARARRKPATGVAALIASLRRDPATREHIPVETVPLAPVPWRDDGPWKIGVLLAARATGQAAGGGIRRPWGYVEWTLGAGGRAAAPPSIVRFSDNAEYNAVVSTVPEQLPHDASSAGPRLVALYRAIDDVLSADTLLAPGLAHLAPLYDGVLPVELDPVVHEMAPGSDDWFRR